jgi:hypothetical protein
MGTILARQLAELASAKHWRGADGATKTESLLEAWRDAKFPNAESLIRLHDAVLFLRAFPQSCEVARRADLLLENLLPEVARMRKAGLDMTPFDSEQVSGIAGTRLRDRFTFDVARWLKHRYPRLVTAAWDIDEQSRPLGAALPRFLPLLEDDAQVEADTPFLTWIAKAAGEGKELEWLLDRVQQSPISPAQRTELYDALGLELLWELADCPASRTLARRGVAELFFHTEPLIQRKQVSLEDEFRSPALCVRTLDKKEGEEILDMCREAVTVRYRELYGTTRGDPAQVYEATPGRGVEIYLWGLAPERRLPLRAYHAGFTLKNGVPINYIEGISLFEWMEIGFNTFYAYRDGETAWIYSKVLHFLQQLCGVTCFSVYPYQLGHENDEAIQSGAFWFYRKLGFRPGKPELLALAQKEERKIASDSSYRTAGRTLRRLANGHVFYEIGTTERGCWDSFSTRTIGFAVQETSKERFGGDAGRMGQSASATLSLWLKVDFAGLSAPERGAFENFAFLTLVAPEIEGWTQPELKALENIIRAKAGPDELDYLHRLRDHQSLRKLVLKLGSRRAEQDGILRRTK